MIVACKSRNLAPVFFNTLQFLTFTKNFKVLTFSIYILSKLKKLFLTCFLFGIHSKMAFVFSNYILGKFKVFLKGTSFDLRFMKTKKTFLKCLLFNFYFFCFLYLYLKKIKNNFLYAYLIRAPRKPPI